MLLIDPFDSGVGKSIETYAKAHGVDVIDYDRLTLGGSAEYYVSFNNVQVGKVDRPGPGELRRGLEDRQAAGGGHARRGHRQQRHPVRPGLQRGAQAVLQSGKWVDVANTADTWDPPTAETEFQEAYTAHPNINAALIPNDETGVADHLVPAVPAHGAQDVPDHRAGRHVTGLDNILSGYQCGTVYKPIFMEARRRPPRHLPAGRQEAPTSLANGKTVDPTSGTKVPSSLLTPEWVTTKNMNATVITDNFVPASQLCAGSYAADCTAAGITP